MPCATARLTAAAMSYSPNSEPEKGTCTLTAAETTTATTSYDDFLEAVIIANTQYQSWRPGQTAFNVLRSMRPEMAEKIRGSAMDPFSADFMRNGHDRIAVFLAHVRENW